MLLNHCYRGGTQRDVEEFFKRWTVWAAVAVEAAAVLIIVLTVAEATLRTLTVNLFRPAMPAAARRTGCGCPRLARRLAVVLDFVVAADILPSLAPLPGEFSGRLTAIAALRTVLIFSLQRAVNRRPKGVLTYSRCIVIHGGCGVA